MIELISKDVITLDLASALQEVTLFFMRGAKCHKFFTDNLNGDMLQIESVSDSNHKEADTRLILHARHASVMRSNRELKQATFLSTRSSAGSKPHRYRWRMMASAVLV